MTTQPKTPETRETLAADDMADSPATSPLTPLQRRILRDIISLMRHENLKAGERLAESVLARKIGTSRTPVNVALQHLVTLGVLTHDLNRGHFLNQDAQALGDLAQALLAEPDEPLYLRIAEDRLSGALPDAINEIDLMRRYAAQRGVVRRVLTRIQQEEWIEKSAGHGWTFLPIIDSNQAYQESYIFRVAIEPTGILCPTFAIVPDELAALRQHQQFVAEQGYRCITPIELFEASCRFHETLAKWSNNRFILQGVRRTDQLRRLVEYRHFTRDREFRHDQALEHLEVLDALAAGDRQKAAGLLKRHLEDALRDKVLKRNVFKAAQ